MFDVEGYGAGKDTYVHHISLRVLILTLAMLDIGVVIYLCVAAIDSSADQRGLEIARPVSFFPWDSPFGYLCPRTI